MHLITLISLFLKSFLLFEYLLWLFNIQCIFCIRIWLSGLQQSSTFTIFSILMIVFLRDRVEHILSRCILTLYLFNLKVFWLNLATLYFSYIRTELSMPFPWYRMLIILFKHLVNHFIKQVTIIYFIITLLLFNSLQKLVPYLITAQCISVSHNQQKVFWSC